MKHYLAPIIAVKSPGFAAPFTEIEKSRTVGFDYRATSVTITHRCWSVACIYFFVHDPSRTQKDFSRRVSHPPNKPHPLLQSAHLLKRTLRSLITFANCTVSLGIRVPPTNRTANWTELLQRQDCYWTLRRCDSSSCFPTQPVHVLLSLLGSLDWGGYICTCVYIYIYIYVRVCVCVCNTYVYHIVYL